VVDVVLITVDKYLFFYINILRQRLQQLVCTKMLWGCC